MTNPFIAPQPTAPKVALIADAVRSYVVGSLEPFTAAEIASVLGEDRARVFGEIKRLLKLGVVQYVPTAMYPPDVRFPFPSEAERIEKTLFEIPRSDPRRD